MPINKVVYENETLIDLTNDTVTPESLAEGVTAHDKSGNAIVGKLKASGDIINVDTLPTSNINEDAIYTTEERRDANVWGYDGHNPANLAQAIKNLFGVSSHITYYVVDTLPSNPNTSNISALTPLYVYICNDIPYVYGNVGNGNSWIEVVDIVSSLLPYSWTNRGYIPHIAFASSDGLYVTYNKKTVVAVPNANNDKAVYQYNGETDKWMNYYNSLLDFIGQLPDTVDIPHGVKRIRTNAFRESQIVVVNIPESVEYIGSYAFNNCEILTRINYKGTKAQWNAIEFGSYWDDGTGNYTVYCTDGTIAKA